MIKGATATIPVALIILLAGCSLNETETSPRPTSGLERVQTLTPSSGVTMVIEREETLTPSSGVTSAFEQEETFTPSQGTNEFGSGIKGTTRSLVVSGVRGGETTGGATSMEFAIAPVENDSPSYSKAIFIKSDEEGKFEVALPPGEYWIGPKAKALDPVNFVTIPTSFSEMIVVVTEDVFAQVEISLTMAAP